MSSEILDDVAGRNERNISEENGENYFEKNNEESKEKGEIINTGRKRKERENDTDDFVESKKQASEVNQDSSHISSIKTDDQTNCVESSTDHANLVASHYNAIEEVGLAARDQSLIIYMRNFNNWIKSMLINEYSEKIKQKKSHGEPFRVLDMCCGKGGDLTKWEKAKISHLICVDIAGVSVEQCQSRYNDNRRRHVPFTAEFLTHDCTKVRLREKYKDPSMHLDLVSCQFAFHYSFESLSQAECMLKNASESLKTGGYFIGTIPNAYELVSRWQKANGKKFGNDIYSIEFQCDQNNVPLFGAKYHFHLEGVVDCPEFLVYFPVLCKLASKFGLDLVMFEKFEDFFQRKKEEGKNLLSKMKALNAFNFSNATSLSTKDSQEYAHAVEYMQNVKEHQKVGTLSKSEWEATTIYSVFAFQKARTTWNAEGKPQFVKC